MNREGMPVPRNYEPKERSEEEKTDMDIASIMSSESREYDAIAKAMSNLNRISPNSFRELNSRLAVDHSFSDFQDLALEDIPAMVEKISKLQRTEDIDDMKPLIEDIIHSLDKA